MVASGFTPVALAVYKNSRWRIVAKITHFAGDSGLILAVAWRNQRGTEAAISLPVAVIEYAKRVGVMNFFLRDDRKMAMFTGPLGIFEKGRLGADSERYIPISWLRAVSWRDWAFAGQIIRLTNSQDKEKVGQETLPGV